MGPWTSPKTTTTGGMFIPPLPHTRMKFPEISNHNTPMKKSERNMIQIQAQHPSILFKELFISLELLRRETFGSSCQIRMSKGIQEKTLRTYPVLMRANTSHQCREIMQTQVHKVCYSPDLEKILLLKCQNANLMAQVHWAHSLQITSCLQDSTKGTSTHWHNGAHQELYGKVYGFHAHSSSEPLKIHLLERVSELYSPVLCTEHQVLLQIKEIVKEMQRAFFQHN